MGRSVGVWVADNSAYMNENETDDSYAVEWTWGAGKKSLLGVLYGLKNGERTQAYWQFFQFWDADKKQMRVIQVSPWGVKGEGFLQQVDSTHTSMRQTFVLPDGNSYEAGHRTEIFKDREVSTSYSIKGEEWIPNRTYIWFRQG